MKLLRYGPVGAEKPAMLDASGGIRCLAAVVRDIDGFTLSPPQLAMLKGIDPTSLPLVEGNPRIGPCVVRPTNYICIAGEVRLDLRGLQAGEGESAELGTEREGRGSVRHAADLAGSIDVVPVDD